jgi:CheY-like chemotaxis protein
VVLDIVMPTMDGGEVLAALREHEGLSDIRAVYFTGLVSESEVGPEGYAVAGHPVISKPVRAEKFRSIVAQQLGIQQ